MTARVVTIGEATARTVPNESVPTITIGDKYGIVAERVAKFGIFSRRMQRRFKPRSFVRIYLKTATERKFCGLFVVKTAFESDIGLCDKEGKKGSTLYQFALAKHELNGGDK